MTLSIVIPTLNEAEELPATLQHVAAVPEVTEVLVCDGGSRDATRERARSAGVRVLEGLPGRGTQLRQGARLAVGDVVVLLHADTWLPPDAGTAIGAVLARPEVVGGAFEMEFRDPPLLVRGTRFRCRLRMRWFQFAYGDQALFVRREELSRAGGVPEVPLMEEFLLCAALRRLGRLALAPATVSTSSRRFRQHGTLRTYLRMGTVTLAWWFGASPAFLQRRYAHGPDPSSRS